MQLKVTATFVGGATGDFGPFLDRGLAELCAVELAGRDDVVGVWISVYGG